MSVVSDVLMEALDNRDITPDEAAFIMRNYYSEGAVRDAVHNISRVMDASREDKASTIEQLKSNKGFSDAEKNVKSYCAKAYKTMTKYSRTIAIKDNANGKADMQNIINGINSAMTKYNSAKKAAEKSDHADITPVVNKIINNLKSAQKCFASDGTPNKEALKKLASNTRMEYGNLGAVNVDAKAPKPKEKESTNESALISFDNDVLSESFFSDMKNKISKKHDTQNKESKNTGAEKSTKKKADPIGGIMSKVVEIRTAANGAMGRKITALKKPDDFSSQDDIKQVNRSMTGYADTVKSNIDKLGSVANGKKYIPGLTKIMNYIKNAISSKNPNDIEKFRINMMGQSVAVVEAYSFEAAMVIFDDGSNYITESETSDLYDKFKAKSQRFNYLATQYRVDMSAGKISSAKSDLKEMSTLLTSMREDLAVARRDSGILETIGYNMLWSLALCIITCAPLGFVGAGVISLDAGIAAVNAGQAFILTPLGWVEFAYDAIAICDEYRRTGRFNFSALNVSMNMINAKIEALAARLARMSNELSLTQ